MMGNVDGNDSGQTSHGARTISEKLENVPSVPGFPPVFHAYTLGPSGNRTLVTELSGRTVQYGYDDLYRLTSETIAHATSQNGTIGYTYDAVGNRHQITSTVAAIPGSGILNYDANDRTATDTWDNDGNMTASGDNVYDFENHLVRSGLVTIIYDGDGNRVSETAGGITTKYLVDTQNPTGYAQVVEEIEGSAVARTYTWGLTLLSKREVAGSQRSFYGLDGHGSVRSLTDGTGTVTDTYDYDAFGNLIASTGSTPNNYLFAGESYDQALGTYYNRARYYQPTNGRFLSMDTDEGDDETPLSLHKYLYAEGDPVDNLDPSGNDIADIGALSIGVTLDAMPQLQIATVLNTVRSTLKGVQVCARPLKRFHGLIGIWHHTYIKILNPKAPNGKYDTYGVLGDPGSTRNQQVRKNDATGRNEGGQCSDCTTSPEQRAKLVSALDYWSSGHVCPSCGANYHNWPLIFDGHNSTFVFNMLWSNPAGAINPPPEPRAPGYHQADSPADWYPKASLGSAQ